jgi:hypothetical protein
MEASIGDLYEAFYAQLENQDRIYEFWITLTFAVAAGTFIAAQKLTKSLLILLSTLYLVVAVNLILRSVVSVQKLNELQSQLVQAGEVFHKQFLNDTIATLTAITYFGGTLGALYFIWHTYHTYSVAGRSD